MSASMADVAPAVRVRIGGPSPAVVVPAAVLLFMVGACFLGPHLPGMPAATGGSLVDSSLPPLSPGHPLGTDPLGNDLLARALQGGQVSFIVGFGSAALSLVVGGTIGIIAGYRRGWVDAVLGRVLDVLLAFPALVLALTIAAYLSPSMRNEILAVTFYLAPACARIARASTLAVRGEDFVVASRLAGASNAFVMLRHIAPNVVSTLITFSILQVGVAMIIEATLSFLGLGVRPPAPSWGNMMGSGQLYLGFTPWVVLVPGAFLFVTICSLNLLGEALRQRRDER